MRSKRIKKFRENLKIYRDKNLQRIIGTNKLLFALFLIITVIYWPVRFYLYSRLENIHLYAENIFWAEFFSWLELLSFVVYAYIHFKILKSQRVKEERKERNKGRIKFVAYSILIMFTLLIVGDYLESLVNLLYHILFPPPFYPYYSISPDLVNFLQYLYGALGEEILIRGILVYGIVRLVQKKTDNKRIISLVSMLISSVIFSALHFRRYPILETGLYPYIILFIGGITLFAIAYYCGLLVSSMAHFTSNFFIVFGFYLWFIPFSLAVVIVTSVLAACYKYYLKRRIKFVAYSILITLFAIVFYCGPLLSVAYFMGNFFIFYISYIWLFPFSLAVIIVTSIFATCYKSYLKGRIHEDIS
jgi:membrane protease YdiL (CAAX protease family)